MADDRWTALTVRSRWEDRTAGGCPPNFPTWRCNRQWLMRVERPLSLTITLSVPQPPPPANGGSEALFTVDAAIGITVLRGNQGVDCQRRKLQLTSPDDIVVRAEPRPVRRLVTQVSLEPSPIPYVVVPHTYMPGKESRFTMVLRADDANDDGVVSAQHAAQHAAQLSPAVVVTPPSNTGLNPIVSRVPDPARRTSRLSRCATRTIGSAASRR